MAPHCRTSHIVIPSRSSYARFPPFRLHCLASCSRTEDIPVHFLYDFFAFSWIPLVTYLNLILYLQCNTFYLQISFKLHWSHVIKPWFIFQFQTFLCSRAHIRCMPHCGGLCCFLRAACFVQSLPFCDVVLLWFSLESQLWIHFPKKQPLGWTLFMGPGTSWNRWLGRNVSTWPIHCVIRSLGWYLEWPPCDIQSAVSTLIPILDGHGWVVPAGRLASLRGSRCLSWRECSSSWSTPTNSRRRTSVKCNIRNRSTLAEIFWWWSSYSLHGEDQKYRESVASRKAYT